MALPQMRSPEMERRADPVGLQEIGEEVAAVLRAAHRSARDLRARTEAECREAVTVMLQEAEATAAAIRAEAEQIRAQARSEAAALRSAAQGEEAHRQALVREIERLQARRNDLVDSYSALRRQLRGVDDAIDRWRRDRTVE